MLITKKRRTLLFIILIVICCMFLQGKVQVAFAASEPLLAFDQTNVIEDLFYSGNPFNQNDYPANNSGDLQILNINEYGFPYYANMADNYGLYIYVYNPAKLNLSTTIGGTKVSMASAYNDDLGPVRYDKYQLRYINKSDDNLFYKYKVIDAEDKIFSRVFEENSILRYRRYDIAGVELVTYGSTSSLKYGSTYKNDVNTIDSDVSLSLTFSGYAEGYGPADQTASTLKINSSKLRTLSLDLKSTFFRTDYYSDIGINHFNQLNSVYFNIPNDYLEQYGVLYGVSAEWEEYKTKDILVTDANEMYTPLYNTRGILASNITGDDRFQLMSEVYSSLWTGWPIRFDNGDFTAEMRYYAWTFNFDEARKNLLSLGFVDYYSLYDCPALYYVFKVNDRFNDVVSGPQLLEYMASYNRTYRDGIIKIGERTFSADLFAPNVDEGRTRGHNTYTIYNENDYSYNLLSLDNSDAAGISKFFTRGKLNKLPAAEEYKNIYPLRQVYNEDVKDLSASTLAHEYLIYEGDAQALKDYTAAASAANSTTYLLRFAATDYYSVPVRSAWKSEDTKKYYYGYVSRETVFFDFDVIDLTFSKNGVYTVIPTVSKPVDVIAAITPPPSMVDSESGLAWWQILLIILAVIVACVLLTLFIIYFGPYIIKGICWLIVLPFKGLAKLFKRIREKLDERRNQKKSQAAAAKAAKKSKRRARRRKKNPKHSRRTKK